MNRTMRCNTKLFTVTFFTLFPLFLATAPVLATTVERISVQDAHQALLSEEPVIFIDTRTEGEWQEASTMISGALRVYTKEDLQRVMKQLPKGSLIIPYCT